MSIETEYKYITEWIQLDGSISFDPQYNGSYFITACDESNMVVAFVFDGKSLDEAFSKLDRAIGRYLEFQETLDEINPN